VEKEEAGKVAVDHLDGKRDLHQSLRNLINMMSYSNF